MGTGGPAFRPILQALASLGNLIVRSSQPVSQDELRKKLIELCRQRDLPYGYFVETLGPRLTPRLLYRI